VVNFTFLAFLALAVSRPISHPTSTIGDYISRGFLSLNSQFAIRNSKFSSRFSNQPQKPSFFHPNFFPQMAFIFPIYGLNFAGNLFEKMN
jgi:hypothetical protein